MASIPKSPIPLIFFASIASCSDEASLYTAESCKNPNPKVAGKTCIHDLETFLNMGDSEKRTVSFDQYFSHITHKYLILRTPERCKLVYGAAAGQDKNEKTHRKARKRLEKCLQTAKKNRVFYNRIFQAYDTSNDGLISIDDDHNKDNMVTKEDKKKIF